MSNTLADFQLLQPTNINEAVAALQQNQSARLCAGGTDLLVNMRHGLVATKTLVDISAIADLKKIEPGQAGLYIGAGVLLCDIAENSLIAKNYPAITEACLSIAGPGHRQAATIGGNLCLDTRCLYYNQSHWWRKANDFCLKYKGDVCHVAPTKKQCRAAFSGDLAPALMVHGAEVEIAGPKGTKRLALDKLYREDGADYLNLEPAEIVVGVHLPPARAISGYRKVRIRGSIDFPLAGVAIACEKQPSAGCLFTLAVTGTNSCPVLVEMPTPLSGKDDADVFFTHLAKQVQKTVTPLRTTTTAANYRRVSISAMAEKLARELWPESCGLSKCL